MRSEIRRISGSVATCLAVAFMLTLSAAGKVDAQQKISERQSATADGVVKINNLAGSVRITGWNRNEVSVEGTLGEGTKQLDFESSRGEVIIKVVLPDEEERRARGIRNIEGSELEIRVPSGSRLEIETLSADITSSGVTGDLRLNALSGNIEVSGTVSDIWAKTLSGDITINDRQASVSVNTLSGTIVIGEAVGTVSASSLSGDINITGRAVEKIDITSTSGDIRYRGELATGAMAAVENFSGEVTLMLPAAVSADFDISTFSGDIDNELGPEAERRSKYGPGKDLTFVTGGGDARVRVKTFSGDISIEK